MSDDEQEPKAETKTFSEKEVVGMILAERRRERRVSTLLECIRLAKAAGMERGYIDEIANMVSEIAGSTMLSEITGLQLTPPSGDPVKKTDE